jgi:hypothetical protein
MSSIIHIKQPQICKIVVKAEGKYNLIVPKPKFTSINVKGLFPSVFVDSEQTTDLLLNYQIAKL